MSLNGTISYGNLLVKLLIERVDSVPEKLDRVSAWITEHVQVAVVVRKMMVDLLPFGPSLDLARLDEVVKKLLKPCQTNPQI